MSTPIPLRNSERSAFNRCRWLWGWSYKDRLQPQVTTPPLRFGTLIHKALEKYYKRGRKRGPHPAKTFEKVYAKELEETNRDFPKWRDEDDEWHEHLELGIEMMKGYVEHYGERDQEYEVLAPEMTFQYPLKLLAAELGRDWKQGKRVPTHVVGTLDGVWKHLPSGRLRFQDFKTAKTIETSYLALDDQAGTYWAVAPTWLIENGLFGEEILQDVEGILYTFLKKSLPDARDTNELGQALNLDGSVSKKQPADRFHRELIFRDEGDKENQVKRILNDALEIGMVYQGKLAVKKQPSKFTCMGCQMKDMCELHETGSDWEAYRDATMVEWDPYSDHNVDLER